MDGQRFDRWAKALAARGGRRATLGLLVGLVGATPGDGKAARSRCQQTRRCTTAGGRPICCAPDELCVGGSAEPAACCRKAKVCGDRCCPPDRVCVCLPPPPTGVPDDLDDLCRCVCKDGFVEDRTGRCVCPRPCGNDCCEDGETCCGRGHEAICVRTSSDRKNCGRCGQRCRADQLCVGGECVCPPGLFDVAGRCIDGKGTCRPGEDKCVNPHGPFRPDRCNSNPECICTTTLEGETRCGMSPPSLGPDESACIAAQCTSSDQCSQFGAGAFCAKSDFFCCLVIATEGFCQVPCPEDRPRGRSRDTR